MFNGFRSGEGRIPGTGNLSSSNKAIALQEPLTPQPSENNKDNSDFTNNALQDLLKATTHCYDRVNF